MKLCSTALGVTAQMEVIAMQTTRTFEEDIVQNQSNSFSSEVEYPESDGEPLGETDSHVSAIVYLLGALRFLFRNLADIYVAADMLFYYVEGKPTIYKVPDVFVVKGVGKHKRRVWKIWEEKISPTVIFEITSLSTGRVDTDEKKLLYARLGVQEYYLFDPLGEYLKPRFQGFRLVNGRYESIRTERDRSIVSRELDAILRPEGEMLRVIDRTTGQPVPTIDEAVERVDEALEQLEIETERLRLETERAQAEAERAQAETERAQAEAERADAAETELARVRAELEQLKRQQTGASSQ